MGIAKQYTFDAAHQLWLDALSDEENGKRFGKCSNLHGHTYSLTVEVYSETLDMDSMVLNYFKIDEIVKPIVDQVDHTFLNNYLNGLTTAENICMYFWNLIWTAMPSHVELWSIKVQETPKTYALVTRDDIG